MSNKMTNYTNAIKVTFLLRKKAPLNLVNKFYIVDTDDHKIAKQTARKQLEIDIRLLSMKLRVFDEDLLSYYSGSATLKINILKP